jgi:hypothetical protein
MTCEECNLPMTNVPIRKVFEYGWFDTKTFQESQFVCEKCGKKGKVNQTLIALNEDFKCQCPDGCQANKVIEDCEKCRPVDHVYLDAMKQ